MELSSGTLLQGGKYKIDKVLGQGGFGITYLAEQTNLGRKVCIKEFFMKEYGERTASPRADSEETVLTGGVPLSSPAPKDTEATVLSDNDSTVLTGVSAVTTGAAEIMGKYREKFVKEARTIARLDHPGIVRIHDVFEENGTAYYVMDFIEGDNLNEIVKREGALPEERALGYIRQIGEALSYVHSHNIMHLDVKPANVIVRKSDGKAILIDFGTAKQYDSEGTQTSTTPVGLSVGYAPIEMTKPGGVQTFSPETDVYSLGATLYYLVTGQNPPDASERMEMIMEGEKFQLPESISSSTAEVIEQSMQARKKRIQTVDGFLDLLQSDGVDTCQKEAETAAEKARAEAEHQEALRKEQERASVAENKRQAEEQAKKDAEVKALKEQEARLSEDKFVLGTVIFLAVFFIWRILRIPMPRVLFRILNTTQDVLVLVYLFRTFIRPHNVPRTNRIPAILGVTGLGLFIVATAMMWWLLPSSLSVRIVMWVGDILFAISLLWISMSYGKGTIVQITAILLACYCIADGIFRIFSSSIILPDSYDFFWRVSYLIVWRHSKILTAFYLLFILLPIVYKPRKNN